MAVGTPLRTLNTDDVEALLVWGWYSAGEKIAGEEIIECISREKTISMEKEISIVRERNSSPGTGNFEQKRRE